MAIVAAALIGAGGCKPPEIQVTETPISVLSDRKGYGRPVREGDRVRIRYSICLPDRTEVLSADDYPFTVGMGSVIRGIDEAVVGMRAGGVRHFVCPPHRHWGRAGYGNGVIPPATDLYVELELLSIEGVAVRRRAEAGPDDMP